MKPGGLYFYFEKHPIAEAPDTKLVGLPEQHNRSLQVCIT